MNARVVRNPHAMVGKPVLEGTRVTVEAVLLHLAETLDIDEVLAAYPRLSRDDIAACLTFASTRVRS